VFTVGPRPFRGYISKSDRIHSRQLRVVQSAVLLRVQGQKWSMSLVNCEDLLSRFGQRSTE
jgi:hypothetical protein